MYLIHDTFYAPDDPGFAQALAEAHAERVRPLCQCRQGGVEMYVAKMGTGYVVKRMPNSGRSHAAECGSYEPPAELSGLGQVMGAAIKEDPAGGLTTLRLGFSMTRTGARPPAAAGEGGDSVTADASKLTLRGLLHYLWDQAEFNRWQPGFAGKRSWATVRKFLRQAAENKLAKGASLADRTYIPEVFSSEHRDEITARRVTHMASISAAAGGPRKLMVLIGEVKEFRPARNGYSAVIKHVPDQPFMISSELFARMNRRFEHELSLADSTPDSSHLVAIATFGLTSSGVPVIEELSLMPVSSQWIPIETVFEQQLIDRLVREGRRFQKGLRYNLATNRPLASVVLTDTGEQPVAMYIVPLGASDEYQRALGDLLECSNLPSWCWTPGSGDMPALPPRARHNRDGQA